MPADSGFSRTWEANEDDQSSLCRKNIGNAGKRLGTYAECETNTQGCTILELFTDAKRCIEFPIIGANSRPGELTPLGARRCHRNSQRVPSKSAINLGVINTNVSLFLLTLDLF
jgi:hypothetical protein